MKKSLRITIMAVAICMILGTWTVVFARAERSSTAAETVSVNAPAGGVSVSSGSPVFALDDLFSDRDKAQTADLSEAVTYTVADGQDISITKAGVYVLTGAASDVTVYVEADDQDKVQLVLDGLRVTNVDAPAIYVKSADKVFVTTSADSSLTVTGSFSSKDKADGVIFSKSDLTLNGTAALTIRSTENGVVGKDDLKVTGGTYVISAGKKAMEANDSIRVAGGDLTLTAGTDALHAENEEDDAMGYVFLGGGTLTIQAGDDGIHATSVLQMDDGKVTITAPEGLEATYVQINGGELTINSQDDGINAANKSSVYRTVAEFNGGTITIAMGGGDTDGVDSNGDIILNGGTISVTGNSAFDYDGTAQFNGGTVFVNGQQVNTLPNQFGGGRGGFGGWGGGNSGGWGGKGGRGGK